MRRIRGIGGVDVEEPGVGGVARSVAISVGGIGGGATRAEFFAARRLRELPNLRVGDAAFRRRRRILRDNTSGRRRTGVVIDPVDEAAAAVVVTNVVGGDDSSSAAFADGHARAIHARAITGPCQLVNPGAQVRVIYGRQAAALFNIQKNYGVRGKAFFLCGGCGGARVPGSPFRRLSFEAIGTVEARLRPYLLEFADLRTAIEKQETEAQRAKELAFAIPRVCPFARWWAEPVTGEGKGFAQNGQRGVAWVVVPVKAKMGPGGGGLRERSGTYEKKTEEKENCCGQGLDPGGSQNGKCGK